MQTLGILEPTDVIDAILAGIVRNMQTDTRIDTYHKHTILGDTPIFHEICLQFQELSKRILEHLLVFLVHF